VWGIIGDRINGEISPPQITVDTGTDLLRKVHRGIAKHHPRNLMFHIQHYKASIIFLGNGSGRFHSLFREDEIQIQIVGLAV
jgi:hypothetical protein